MKHIDNLEHLLSSNDTNGSVVEFDNFIGALCDYGDNMDVLTEPQKNFYHNQNLEREINNGGFNQYFFNSSGDFAHETLQSLKQISADHTAKILQKAIDQFPHQQVPKDRNERIEVVKQIETTVNEIWEELDQKFYEYVDDLTTLNIEYIRRNREHF